MPWLRGNAYIAWYMKEARKLELAAINAHWGTCPQLTQILQLGACVAPAPCALAHPRQAAAACAPCLPRRSGTHVCMCLLAQSTRQSQIMNLQDHLLFRAVHVHVPYQKHAILLCQTNLNSRTAAPCGRETGA